MDSKPHLKGYVPSILAFEDGPANLGNMIAAADYVEELRENYTEDNIRVAAGALLDKKYLHGFVKFAKSVSRDETLWKPLVDVFSEKIGELPQKWTDDAQDLNFSLLDSLCDKYPDLAAAVTEAAEKPAQNQISLPAGTGQSLSPC